jgi:hypothetical protein
MFSSLRVRVEKSAGQLHTLYNLAAALFELPGLYGQSHVGEAVEGDNARRIKWRCSILSNGSGIGRFLHSLMRA